MYDVNGLKLPFQDFFNKWDDVYSYGEESRIEALEITPEKKVVVDIGSHVGISILHWAKHFDKVYGFEPMLDHFNCLKENTKNIKNLVLENCAISNEERIMKGAYRTMKNSGAFTLLPDTYQQPKSIRKHRTLFDIPSKKLDSFTFERIDLLKIDVEGWEFEVLKGAKETIKKHKPVLLVEFTGGDWKKSFLKYDPTEYNKFIKDLGYKEVKKVDIDTIYEFDYDNNLGN